MNRFTTNIFLLSSILFLTVSCSKQNGTTNPDNQKIVSIQLHVWVSDSTNTVTPTYNVMLPDIPTTFCTFSADSMILNFPGTAFIRYGISYEAPNKIFFWLPTEMKNPNEYLIIDSINDSALIVKEIDVESARTRIRYYHAQ